MTVLVVCITCGQQLDDAAPLCPCDRERLAHAISRRLAETALARSIQRAERERDELLSDWKEIDALPPVRAAFEEGMRLVDAVAKAIADVHYAEGTPLFDAEVAKSFAEHERDEARAERDAIAAQLATLREAAERYEEVAEVPAGHLDTIQDLARDTLRAALADLPGAVREREARQAERERAIAKEGYRVGHGNLASGRPELSDAEADEIVASVRGRT